MNLPNYHAHYKFIEAVLKNNLDFIYSVINDKDFVSKNPFSWTPLHYAAAFDNVKLSRNLLEIKLDYLDCEDRYCRTALSIAARRGNIEIVRLLLSHGANLRKGLPLCYAVTSGDVACVLALLEGGCNVNEIDLNLNLESRWYNPLLIAIDKHDYKFVPLLINYKAYTDLNIHTVGMTHFHYACRDSTLKTVKALAPKVPCLDIRTSYGSTPLDLAMLNDNFDVVKYLLQIGASVNSVGKLGQNALHAAVMSQSVANVLEVLKYRPHLNRRDSYGRTPFYICCRFCHTDEIFDILIMSEVDVSIGCYKSWTPLHLCCTASNLRRVRSILERISDDGVNAVTMNNITPLYLAVCGGDISICRDLLRQNAYINIPINKYRDLGAPYPFRIAEEDIVVGHTAETIAAEKGKYDIVRLFNYRRTNYPHGNLQHLKITEFIMAGTKNENYFAHLDLEETDLLGWTVLHYAAELGHYELAKFYVRKFRYVNVADKYGRTPLTLAAASGHLELVKLLIANGANPNLGSAIFYAIDNNQLPCLRYILNKSNIQVVDGKNQTPVMYAVMKNNLAILQVLLQASTNVNQTDRDMETALHHASWTSPDLIQLLIDKGADVNAQNTCSETPLHVATTIENYAVMECLLMNSADPNIADDERKTPLHHAVCNNSVRCTELILKYRPNVNAVDYHTNTPLHYSLYFETTDVFKLLVRYGAQVNTIMQGGLSCWHICAFYGNLDVAKELFKHNADINALSEDGVSPLCIASAEGHQDFVKMLIQMGAVLDTPTMGLGDWRQESLYLRQVPPLGRVTPLIAAVCNGHAGIAALLRAAGAATPGNMQGPQQTG